jgi:tetratricopeptide (TPR) repeat protein
MNLKNTRLLQTIILAAIASLREITSFRWIKIFFTAMLFCVCLSGCNQKPSLREQVSALKKEWGYAFPLPSKNDSINLLYIQLEKAYFTLEFVKVDSLANKILAIDSTFYMALSFQAFGKWPFDLEKLKLAKAYSLKDTTIQRLIFGGDYSYWIENDTVTALNQYSEVYRKYPDSKIAAWLAGMASLWSRDYPKAIYYYKRSLEIDPTFYHAYYDLGDTYLESKEYKLAIENYELFLRYFPSKFKMNRVIGDAYMSLGDSANAKKHYHLVDSLTALRAKELPTVR